MTEMSKATKRTNVSDVEAALGLNEQENTAALAKSTSNAVSKGKGKVGGGASKTRTSSRLDATEIQTSYAAKIAEPLQEALAMNQRLSEGFEAAAQHILDKQQEIVDKFYEDVSQGLDRPVEINHFLSQVPEELAKYFH